MNLPLALACFLILLSACSHSHRPFCEGNTLHTFEECGSCPGLPLTDEWNEYKEDCGKTGLPCRNHGGTAACVNLAAPVCTTRSQVCDGPTRVRTERCVGGHFTGIPQVYPCKPDEQCVAEGDGAQCVLAGATRCTPGSPQAPRCSSDGTAILELGCSASGYQESKGRRDCTPENPACVVGNGQAACIMSPQEACDPEKTAPRITCSADKREFTTLTCSPAGFLTGVTKSCMQGYECLIVEGGRAGCAWMG